MATKHTDSCLQKAGDDEPIFVLRATDKLAPLIVDIWADKAEALCAPIKKVAEARELADKMRVWQKANGAKIPD